MYKNKYCIVFYTYIYEKVSLYIIKIQILYKSPLRPILITSITNQLLTFVGGMLYPAL